MAITRPVLPPKKGYVEVEVHGRRTYKNVETGELIENEVRKPTPEERIAGLEDALCEMDSANEDRMAAIEDALCEMDMK